MAGRGPAPSANRRRRNAPTRGEWIDLAPLAEPVLPKLPEGEEWPAATLGLWEAWRADPVTAQWGPADVALAIDTIRLHATAPSAKASEIRLRMDNLGLSPKGKRDNRWRLAKPDAPAEEPAPVTRLRVVDA